MEIIYLVYNSVSDKGLQIYARYKDHYLVVGESLKTLLYVFYLFEANFYSSNSCLGIVLVFGKVHNFQVST